MVENSVESHQYQVVVVGSGPAGSVAAGELAKNGVSVLLVDGQPFPRDKTCGDGVPNGAHTIFESIPDLNKEIDGRFRQVDHILIGSPNGGEIRTELGGKNYVIPRLLLDDMIRNSAIQAGSEILTARVTDLIFDKGQVVGIKAENVGQTFEIESQLVIGADGATSTIARKLGVPKHPDNQSAVAVRAYLHGIEGNAFEFYLFNELQGYGWGFPVSNKNLNNVWNVGIGMRTDEFKKKGKKLEDMLGDFINILKRKGRLDPNYKLENVAQWHLPLAMRLQEHKIIFNGAALVGDAARLINPLTGGGISSGVESSAILAEVVIKLLQKNTGPIT